MMTAKDKFAFGATDLGIVGRVLSERVRDESMLAYLVCEIGDAMKRSRGDAFDQNVCHGYLAELREAKAAKPRR